MACINKTRSSLEFQVKCHSSQPNTQVIDAFRQFWCLREGESCPSSVQDKWDRFYLMGRSLLRMQLPHRSLERAFESFMCRFGSFTIG
jgi:hypothetical protein